MPLNCLGHDCKADGSLLKKIQGSWDALKDGCGEKIGGAWLESLSWVVRWHHNINRPRVYETWPVKLDTHAIVRWNASLKFDMNIEKFDMNIDKIEKAKNCLSNTIAMV